jgi:hypothetical protein
MSWACFTVFGFFFVQGGGAKTVSGVTPSGSALGVTVRSRVA